MERFWGLIRPILDCEADSLHVLELVDTPAALTSHVLQWVHQSPKRQVTIGGLTVRADEAPLASDGRGGQVHTLPMLGLNAITHARWPVDAVLLHEDPNWYTVYHQLASLLRQSQLCEAPFPLVFVQGVDWPYSRRDGYRDPNLIPDSCRHVCKPMGLDPRTGDLVPTGGLFAGRHHAVYEMPLRNGVRTAVEDFLAEARPYNIHATFVPGHGGLAIVASQARMEANAALRRLQHDGPARLSDWNLIECMEQARLETAFDLAQAHAELSELRRSEQTVRKELDSARRRAVELSEQLKAHQADRDRLAAWIHSLGKHVRDLLASRRWRVGDGIARLLNRLRGRRRTAMATDFIEEILREFRTLEASWVPQWEERAASIDETSAHLLRALSAGPLDRRHLDVFMFPVIDWDFRFQRPQHLAVQLGRRGHRVFYFSTQLRSQDEEGALPIQPLAENVYGLPLMVAGHAPRMPQDGMSELQAGSIAAALDGLRQRLQSPASVALVNHPAWVPILRAQYGMRIVYDCLDYHAGFHAPNIRLHDWEQELLGLADLVVASSRPLMEHIATRGTPPPVELIRNGTDPEHFVERPPRVLLEREPGRPVLGYFGAIAEWFDSELVAAVASELPDCDVVLIGSTIGADLEPLHACPNVRLLGEIPYAKLPAYAHGFDVCLIPFRHVELTRCTNPVKLYEYLAMGKPVVSIDLPEVREVADAHGDDLVRVGHDTTSFVHAVRQALQEPIQRNAHELESRRCEFARANTWTNRGNALASALDRLYPRISVVVLTFNNLGFTQACVQSLDEHTDYPNWELVLVDNASTDGTREYLQSLAESRKDTKVVLNPSNKGFAAGNNIGVRAASGEWIVLLNNDTFVTPGWLDRLHAHFRRDPSLGIICPVTNNIGNEARIEIHYANMAEMIERAQAYTASRVGTSFDLPVAALFCAMVSRKVWDEVGELDESFGLGYFEDDDFCRRIREAGYRVACAEDVFVHHHLSASFGQLPDDARHKLFERNKKRYEEKWGAWQPHQYREASSDAVYPPL